MTERKPGVLDALVIGQGSIGRRHARLLDAYGASVSVVTGRADITGPSVFGSLDAALAASNPGLVIVANRTVDHAAAIKALAMAGFTGTVLVEKPLFAASRPIPENRFGAGWVGYNLRHHPVLEAVKAIVESEPVLTAQIQAGQYLPDWRPGTDYRLGYSAKATQGGGVLRDLSHELDYARWLFGDCLRLTAVATKSGTLEIDSDECWVILAAFERCPAVTIAIDYLARPAYRRLALQTATHRVEADLIEGRLITGGRERRFTLERDAMYRRQLQAILDGDATRLCGFADGCAVVRMIEAVELAARTGGWVEPRKGLS